MASLKKGTLIPLSDGRSAEILAFIAEGGQGEVYRVRFQEKEYALKWYKLPLSEAFYNNLAHNIEIKSPAEQFLWPVAITKRVMGKFGYIMPLCPPNYAEYGDFLLGNARFASWEMMIQAALNITEGFRILHSMGYSYQDVNEGSFFIDPNCGDVLICDNDNVAPYGTNLGVKGTPRYMAPEVLLNQTAPNTHTDRFSLAIILFRLFYIDHPLEGQKTVNTPLTDETGAEMFGRNPVFVYDPKNKENRPVRDAHPNVIKRRKMFPPDLMNAFTVVFTDGLKDINRRLNDMQWQDVLVKVRGMLIRLDGHEQFVNAYQCETLPMGCRVLDVGQNIIVLTPGSKLYLCQLDSTGTDYTTPVAVVKANKSNPNVYGLGNFMSNDWTLIQPNRPARLVKYGEFAPLMPGIVIDFGNIKGKVF